MIGLKRIGGVSAVAAAALLLASPASAATYSRSGSRSGSVGNTQAGASYSLNGSVYANDAASVNEAYVRLWGDATAKLLGQSGQLASLNAKAAYKGRAAGDKGQLDVLVKACGFNVVNLSQKFAANLSKTYSKTYSATFLSARATFWVWIIPVTFTGNVGGGASMNLTYRIGVLRADLSGGPKAWGSTSAKAGIGIGRYSLAGVGTTAKLLDTYLRSNAGVGFLAGQKKGAVDLVITPLSADFWYQILGFSKRVIAKWSTANSTYRLATIY